MKKSLKRKWKNVEFIDYLNSTALAAYYTHADITVFPSKTDTFGITIIESIACGTPVAAYPVTGPIDIITQGKSGYMDDDLSHSVKECLKLPKEGLPSFVDDYTWEKCSAIFEQNIELIGWKKISKK